MALVEIDIFNPNTWIVDEREFRIYADDYANDYAIVDQIDYQYLAQWRWKISLSKKRPGKRRKGYLSRTVPKIVGKDEYVDGKRIQNRITSTVYLHKVVMERMNITKPKTNKQLIVDHKKWRWL